ncbi:MAG: L-serine ammonia-lyase, iron-sulfur-dependent, subunit alpha [Oscillospiraceae bacterium]|nr:L-serine ammonia-lyase, iron-sulfur-dependent, subunit alpha [Oscillospiraceae bacterium]
MSFRSISEIQQLCSSQSKPFWQVVLETDAEEQGISVEASVSKMQTVWQVMRSSIESYDPDMVSASGFVGPEGGIMDAYAKKGNTLCGPFVSRIVTRALMMGCSNACMRRIVAAPTAGSCGVLPALLYTCQEEYGCSDEEMLHALYVSAGVGQVIANRASISGAEGGCQAEIGSASGMAASALVALRGGSPQQMADACAIALKNLMGLVCDPVGGLVEIPCVKRNVVGAVNALTAADMALAGITSAIPADQVIDAMRQVGDGMSTQFKETSKGGIAVTPRGKELADSLK